MGRRQSEATDIKQNVNIDVLTHHIRKAKRCKHGECALALALKDAGYDDMEVDGNVVYMLRKEKWWRAMAGDAAKLIISMIDRNNQQVINWPEHGHTIVFHPAKGVRRLEYLHSDKFKAQRKASAERRKGKPKGDYNRTTSISLQEIRNGAGHFH